MRKHHILAAALTFSLSTAHAEDPCAAAPDPALCRVQARSAGVISNLVAQTRLYQEGVFEDIEAKKQMDAYREGRRDAEAQQARAAPSGGSRTSGGMSERDRADWENAQSDMRSRFSSASEKKNARETLRMIESRSNANVAAAPPEVNIHNRTTVIDSRQRFCNNGWCY